MATNRNVRKRPFSAFCGGCSCLGGATGGKSAGSHLTDGGRGGSLNQEILRQSVPDGSVCEVGIL